MLDTLCAEIPEPQPITRGLFIGNIGSIINQNQGISPLQLNLNAATNTGMYVISEPGYYYLTEDLEPTDPVNSNPVILINSNNVLLDLGTRSIIAVGNITKITAAIQIADGVSNIIIQGGTISDIDGGGLLVNNVANTSTNIMLKNLRITGCGHFGASFTKCKNVIFENVQCNSNGPWVDETTDDGLAGGASFTNVNSIVITNSSFSNNGWNIASATKTLQVHGVYFNNCTNVLMTDCLADNNANTTTASAGTSYTAGIYLTATTACRFANVSASRNSSLGNNGSCYGIYLTNSSANGFVGVATLNNQGTGLAAGIMFDAASGNRCTDCDSGLNNAYQTESSTDAHAYGYFCKNTSGNVFLRCSGKGNYVVGSTTATRTVAGFCSKGAIATKILHCYADLNNIASQSSATSFAAGIQLGDSDAVETNALIEGAKVTNNTTIASNTSAPVYGIVILPSASLPGDVVSSGTIIQGCEVSYNLSKNTAAGLSYGIVDRTPGSTAASPYAASTGATTLLRANISVGHGAVYDAGNVKTLSNNNMNFYLDYKSGSMLLSNVVKETTVAGLNIIATTPGADVYNWSFTTE